jgi:AcrR family transcriptional regulator
MLIKKSNNKTNTKDKIIQAAYKEFSEKGFDGARMQKIAERAKINKAMLHYYFKDKETLYETVIEYFHLLFNEIIAEKNVEANTRKAFLKQTIDAYYHIFFEYPDFKKIFIQELASGLKTMKKIYSKQAKEIKKIAEKFFLLNKIKELQKNNEIRNDIDEEHIMLSIIGLMESALIQTTLAQHLLDYHPKDLEEFIEKRKEAIIKILDKGLSP